MSTRRYLAMNERSAWAREYVLAFAFADGRVCCAGDYPNALCEACTEAAKANDTGTVPVVRRLTAEDFGGRPQSVTAAEPPLNEHGVPVVPRLTATDFTARSGSRSR